jgi:hypothetical protein
MLSRGAAVGEGRAVGAGERHAPASLGVSGRGADDVPGFHGVQQAPAACLGGRGVPAEESARVDEEVDDRGRRRAGRDRVGGRPRQRCAIVIVVGVFVAAWLVAGAGPDADRGVSVPAPTRAAASVLVLMQVLSQAIGGRIVGAVPIVGGILGDWSVRRARVADGHGVLGRFLVLDRFLIDLVRRVVCWFPVVSGRFRDRGEAVEGVAALEQVVEGRDAQVVKGALYAAAAQAEGGGVDVGLGGQRVGDVEFATRDRRVPRPLKLNLDALGGPLGALLAGPRRLRVEFHLEGGGPSGKRVGADVRRGLGQDLVGLGRVFRSKAGGVRGDDPGPLGVDQTGGHALQRPRQAGGEADGRVDPPSGRQPADEQLGGQLDAGELPGPAAGADAAGLRGLEFLVAATGELGDQARLQVMGAVLQPQGRLQRAEQLVVGEPRQVGGRLLGQRGQHRAGSQQVRRRILTELRTEPITAQAIRPAYRGQHHRIDVGGVAEADRDRRPLDLPWLGRRLVTSGGDLPLAPGQVRIPVRVRRKVLRVRRPAPALLRRVGPWQLALVHGRPSFRMITIEIWPTRTQ